jgi:hypothetical protein
MASVGLSARAMRHACSSVNTSWARTNGTTRQPRSIKTEIVFMWFLLYLLTGCVRISIGREIFIPPQEETGSNGKNTIQGACRLKQSESGHHSG